MRVRAPVERCGRRRAPSLRRLLHVFFISNKLGGPSRQKKKGAIFNSRRSPSSRPATYESAGVFTLLFMQGFLWNAGIGWTIPNRNSCVCSTLIKAVSCTNTLHPAPSSPGESDFQALFKGPPLWPLGAHTLHPEASAVYRSSLESKYSSWWR